MQRIGYAVGAALCGIVANASGFSEGLSGETAESVAQWLFLAFVPLGVIGCLAAIGTRATLETVDKGTRREGRALCQIGCGRPASGRSP